MDELYLVAVSSLEVRSNPDTPSKVFLKRDTAVSILGDTRKKWVKIKTHSEPVISGYTLKRYLKKV